MTTKKSLPQFVLMPAREEQTGEDHLRTLSRLFAPAVRDDWAGNNFIGSVATLAAFQPLTRAPAPSRPLAPPDMRVVDLVRVDRPMLVEMSAQSATLLRERQPELRLEPVLYYETARAQIPAPIGGPQPASAKSNTRFEIKVVAKKTGEPIGGAEVTAFTDYKGQIGVRAKTNSKGLALLNTLGAEKFQRFYIKPPKQGYWGLLKRNVAVTNAAEFELEPVDLSFRDALRTLYPASAEGAGLGVKIAVVDRGIAEHPDLVIDGGFNAVPGEAPGEFGDNGMDGHGTHVAGIIGARGMPPHGLRGLAPGARLRSYRAFGQGARAATNYTIGKAIDQAVDDGCHLINLSIEGGPFDEVLADSIARANARGSLVIAAAGNDSDHRKRKGVCFPASAPRVIAVSALGRRATWPRSSVEDGDVAPPFSSLSKAVRYREFVARFSNVGKEITFTAPGVGILSTVPGGYAPMSGTSMACPAVTGAAAQCFSSRLELLEMQPDPSRTEALAQALFLKAQPRGFDVIYEGRGLLMVS